MAESFTLPGDFGLPSVSQLYVSGIAIESAIGNRTIVPEDPDSLPARPDPRPQSPAPSQQIAPSNRFWASPPHPLNWQWSDGIVINLAKKKKINYLAIDLPIFPHHFYFHYWDDAKKDWFEFKGPSTGVLRVYIDGSIPAVIGSATAYQAKQHPSHYGAGHWQHYDLDVVPVTTSKIRILGLRNFGSRMGGPKDIYGRDAKYSLGVRNFDFGWRVRTKNDVPLTARDPDILTERQSFTQVLDIMGSPVELKVRENRASDLLAGSVWKSEPMPVPYAVVNFYVDARDPSGNAQTIDRFNVTPLTSGANMNLYYAKDVPDSDFGASDAPIVFPSLRMAGEADPTVGDSGILFPDKISYIDLDNQAVQWNPAKPFWIAVEFQPQWGSEDASDPHIIFDTGALQLAWNDGVFRLGYGGGALYQQPFEFSANARLNAVVVFDGATLSFYIAEAGGVANVPTEMEGMTSSVIRLGAEVGDSTAPIVFSGFYRLNALLIKQESLSLVSGPDGIIIPEPIQRFISSPEVYLNKPEYHLDNDGSTDNALVRYLPSFALGSGDAGVNPYGFVGGPGSIYEDVVWTPITRDYKLRAGMLQFMPVKAKFFKFEFSNLTPEPYQTFQPITRKVKTYSPSASTPPANPQLNAQTQTPAISSGMSVNAAVAPSVSVYSDTPDQTDPGTTDVLATEALHATDLGVQGRLDSLGSIYGFDSWQPVTHSTRYTTTSVHTYEEVEVGHSKRVAYFVGLAGLQMFRVDYAADDDTEQYIDLLDDTDNIDPDYLAERIVVGTTNWVTNPSFENGATGHTPYTNGTVTSPSVVAVADGLYGPNALKAAATVLGAASTDRVGWQATYTTPDFEASIAYSIYAKRVAGSATLRLNVEYYTAGAAFISSDTQSFTPDAELGPVLNTNPGFETDLTGWTAQGGTFTRSTAQFHAGASSGQIVPDGVTSIVRINSALMPVTAGKSYRAQGWLRCASARTVNLNVNWYDANGVYLSTGSNAMAISANTWTFLFADMLAPAGAAQAIIIPTMTGTPPAGHTLWADEVELHEVINGWQRCTSVMLPPPNTASAKVYWWLEAGAGAAVEYHFDGYQIENLRLTDYCDGTQEGAHWNGTANASTSTRDDVNIRPWTWDGDKLNTSAGLDVPATTISRRYASKRRVRGVQFATSQSGAVQLVPDPDFNDTGLESWQQDGDVISMELSDDINATLGSAIKIHRSSALNSWGELRATYQTWEGVQTSAALGEATTYALLEGDHTAVGFGGIRLRNPVQVSEAGRVYAAARVYSDHALTNPLTLQILSFTGDVLAESTHEVVPGKVIEWFVGYTIGEVPSISQSWADIMQRDASPSLPTYGDLEAGLWADLMSIEIAQSRQLSVRIIQQGSGEDTWYVDSLALFEDAIKWEFSNDDGANWWAALDIRNNPSGVLIFPNSLSPVPTDPTGLRWRVTGYRPNLHISSIDIRPWYAETVFGIPRREAGVSGGPNIQPTDHYPPIADDPMFKQWAGPIPQDWYFVYRQLLLLDNQQVPVTPIEKPDTFANPMAALVEIIPEPTIPPFLDLYSENYPAIYGVPNSALSDTFGDDYDPGDTF